MNPHGLRGEFLRGVPPIGVLTLAMLGCSSFHGGRGGYMAVMPPDGRPLIVGATRCADCLWGSARESALGDGVAESRRSDLEELVRRFAPTLILPPGDFVEVGDRKMRLLPVNVSLLTDTLRLDVFSASPYLAVDSLNIPLREITVDSLQSLAATFLDRSSTPEIMVELYFDFPGRSAREWWQSYASRRTGPDSLLWATPTVYAHPFLDPDQRLVIQYWYLFPFNDFVGNHEGDWEHVNVVPTADRSAVAEVHYYFHHRSTILPRDGYAPEVVDGTHPVVYTGGRMYHLLDYPIRVLAGERNEGSHGMFPYPGEWENVAAFGAPESVKGVGDSSRVLSHRAFDVILMPEATRLDPIQNPEVLRRWAWMLLPVRWGYPRVPSLGWELTRADVGNRAPYGPSYHIAWNRGAPGHYYQDYRVKRIGWFRSAVEDLLQPWYYPYVFRKPRYIHDTSDGAGRQELARAGVAPKGRSRERGIGSGIFGAHVGLLRGPAGEDHERSTGISLWSNLWVKGRVGAFELAGGYQRFARTEGNGGSLFVYPFTASLAARMPDALFRPYATIGGGIYGWESRVRSDSGPRLLTNGWHPGWTSSLGLEYYLRTYVALDISVRDHRTRAPARAGSGPADGRLRYTSVYVGHYVRF